MQSFGGGGSIKLSCIVWMTLVGLYQYRKTHSCRVSRPLPSARPRALGKDEVCRVPGRGHSAKTWHTACPHFAKCWPLAKWGTRQRLIFAECRRARTRQRPPTCPARAPAVRRPLGWLTAFSLCRVPPPGTRQSSLFAECLPLPSALAWLSA